MRPLADVRVLDLSRLLPGPFATLVLADLGASVDKIEDAGGGEWFVNASDTGPSIAKGKEAADCTITLTSEDFQKFHENPQANGMQLFFAGKLKVDGNQMLAMKLSKLFTIGA